MKSGFDMSVDFNMNWQWYWNNDRISVSELAAVLPDIESLNGGFRNTIEQYVTYTSPNIGQAPILTLAASPVGWKTGDQILVASTSWDPRESEVFTIVDCQVCEPNQVKIDRAPNNTHWGRIDPRTGADQRAEVALLSRNVRFFGEMSSFGIERFLTLISKSSNDQTIMIF